MSNRRSKQKQTRKLRKHPFGKPWNTMDYRGWFTKGIEFLMIFFSLLWAIEARATDESASTSKDPSRSLASKSRSSTLRRPNERRTLAAYGSKSLSNLVPVSPLVSFGSYSSRGFIASSGRSLLEERSFDAKKTGTSGLQLFHSTVQFSGFLAPESVFSGNNLAPSFKQGSLYVPQSLGFLHF